MVGWLVLSGTVQVVGSNFAVVRLRVDGWRGEGLNWHKATCGFDFLGQ